jgi:phosphotransferase system enzyme I (PtsI)
MTSSVPSEQIFRGAPVHGGIVRGRVHFHGFRADQVPSRPIQESDIPLEIARFEEALIKTRQQLLEIQRKFSEAAGTEDATIFDAHLLVLEDRTLIEEVIKHLHSDRENVEAVFDKVSRRYSQALAAIDDPYLRERSADIADVTQRILRNLAGGGHDDLQRLPDCCILIANHLTPSEAAQLSPRANLGIAIVTGSVTSHTAILLRAKGIPSIVALHGESSDLEEGATALLDGYNGLLIVHPRQPTLLHYAELESRKHTVEMQLEALRDEPAETLDGRRLTLSANLEALEEIPNILAHGGEGVGLFRTEYIFLNRRMLPSEEEQFAAYARVAEAFAPAPVVVRTLDLGRDKLPTELGGGAEANPFLGWCSIRYCLENPEILRTQLRAILRANSRGNVKVMFPMISNVAEVRQARALLEEAKSQLHDHGVAFNPQIEVGVMIETPGAALTAELIAAEVDFFSIGTNDLTQYALAVDRTNERVAHLYQPTHPAVMRLLCRIVEAGRARGIWIGLCGEMASDFSMTPLLVGLELDELSVNANSVPVVKRVIRSMKFTDAQALARAALELSSGEEIYELSRQFARQVAPDLF